jgi:hypothetical protein
LCLLPHSFSGSGWDFPLSQGKTRRKAIKNAEKDLAFSLAGILYDNEELPEPIPVQNNNLSQGVELIDVETSFKPYAEVIQEHLEGRHWHISYYVKEFDEVIGAIEFKNYNGMWDIFFEDYLEEVENTDEGTFLLLSNYILGRLLHKGNRLFSFDPSSNG